MTDMARLDRADKLQASVAQTFQFSLYPIPALIGVERQFLDPQRPIPLSIEEVEDLSAEVLSIEIDLPQIVQRRFSGRLASLPMPCRNQVVRMQPMLSIGICSLDEDRFEALDR